jgi:hypothetical protein
MSFHSKWGVALDISLYQENVDIPYIVKASNGKVKTIIAKAMQLLDAGEDVSISKDAQFDHNCQGAQDAGIPFGVYIFHNGTYHLRDDAKFFASNQQIQTAIKILNPKIKNYHYIALDLEDTPETRSMTPNQWLASARLGFEMLKEARYKGLIRNVPIGLYTNHYFIKDRTVVSDGGSLWDDVASGYFDFVWEARYNAIPAGTNVVKTWDKLDDCVPPDNFHPTGLNGIRYWDAVNYYQGNMKKKLVFWQFNDGWKFPLASGRTSQAVDLNYILATDAEFYDWLKFTPTGGTTNPPVEPPVNPPTTGSSVNVDLSEVNFKLDKILGILNKHFIP